MKAVIVFAEGSFELIEQLANEAEARAFCSGLSCGANLYGAGSCTGYVMPDDEEDMRDSERDIQVGVALRKLATLDGVDQSPAEVTELDIEEG